MILNDTIFMATTKLYCDDFKIKVNHAKLIFYNVFLNYTSLMCSIIHIKNKYTIQIIGKYPCLIIQNIIYILL